jgi:citrate lyase subunit beta / citryl-CoA lyase
MRSFLYVPAHSDRFIAKAHERGADAIVLDLEDAVPPAEKDRARAGLPDAVQSVGRNGAAVFVRVNAEPELLAADAEAACRAGAFGLFVPKARDPQELNALATQLQSVERDCSVRPETRLVPLIEDPGAVLDARAIAMATPRVFGLITGGEDLATAMDAQPTPEVLRMPKLLVHLTAKAAGVHSFGLIRTVADFADVAAVTEAAAEARAFGFDGATCVHPSIVPILNQAFSTTQEEVERALRLVAAAERAAAQGQGAFMFDGKMVDRPIVERARAVLVTVRT